MLVYELRRIQHKIDQAAARNATGLEAHAVLQKGNADIQEKLSEAVRQLEDWKRQLDARRRLQQLLANTLPEDDDTRLMWWHEQVFFYESLIGQVEAYFTEDNTGYLTLSLTALELLFLARLSIEVGVVKADSLQTVFKSLSKCFGTEKQGSLSYESLKKRYSVHHEGARKNIKHILTNMIRHIDHVTSRS